MDLLDLLGVAGAAAAPPLILDHGPRDVPLGRVVANLVLDQHTVSYRQPQQSLGVLAEALHVGDGALGQCLLPVLVQHDPLGVRLVAVMGAGRKSLRARPKMTWAGLLLVSLSGVFL